MVEDSLGVQLQLDRKMVTIDIAASLIFAYRPIEKIIWKRWLFPKNNLKYKKHIGGFGKREKNYIQEAFQALQRDER